MKYGNNFVLYVWAKNIAKDLNVIEEQANNTHLFNCHVLNKEEHHECDETVIPVIIKHVEDHAKNLIYNS